MTAQRPPCPVCGGSGVRCCEFAADRDTVHTVRGALEPPEIPVHPRLVRDREEWIAVCECCGEEWLAMQVPGTPRDMWPEIQVRPGQVFYALDVREITLPIGWRVLRDPADDVDVVLCPFCAEAVAGGD